MQIQAKNALKKLLLCVIIIFEGSRLLDRDLILTLIWTAKPSFGISCNGIRHLYASSTFVLHMFWLD